MATLVLSTVGSALGSAVGGPIGGAVGRVIGAAAGSFVDQSLFGGHESPRHVEGPRLKDLDGLASTEGAPIPRVYGRARIGGQLIWATRFEEIATTSVDRSASRGGKGSARQGGSTTTVKTTYSYFGNFAIGLCEGPISFVRRVWADGRELDLTTIAMRVHRGDEAQPPDPLIVAKEGAENAPAYRGLAYVVFERLALEPFGNRVPQFSFEVVRAVDGVGSMIRAVCLIPGATEFGYDVYPVTQMAGFGVTRPENRHQLHALTDATASLDALQALCPNLERVSLVVSWFGDDLRAGHCTVMPRVEQSVKQTYGAQWFVAGLTRAAAPLVSQVNGAAAYGGTPSDLSVARMIQELKARGIGVVLYPFLMMDVPAGNALPDPSTGMVGQPAYPWRGRITCDPAPGRAGTVDGTAGAATQIDAFFGSASSPGWNFRGLVMHYARLAAEAGGVDGFIVGSELVSLTRVRSAPGVYPAVAKLAELAADVRAVVGPATKIVYAADWTEYGAHVLGAGAELRFPLDAVWAHPAIDAVGIDYYPPVADWRDGPDHADLAEATSAYDLDYLQGRLAAGEAFDWFYASAADRHTQTRTPITDGAYQKPWTYRAKDLVGWWSNRHVERVNGVEAAATAWAPCSKPIWLTEIGVPAVDKGANSPNVFPDPKSSESAVPPFSRGTRDDLMQARALEAVFSRFDAALPGHPAGANPVSPVYGGPMVDPGRIFVWAWDARPFPAFPDFDLVWADARNWEAGHWITGRLEGVTLDRLFRAVLADFGIDAPCDATVEGFVDGYVVDRPMSAREALEPLARLFGVSAAASAGRLKFGRSQRRALALAEDDFIRPERDPVLRLVRAQETELPHQVELGFTDSNSDYRRAAVGSRRLAGSSRREARADFAVVIRREEAQRLADTWLQDLWAARETAEFGLSLRHLALDIGDVVAIPTEAGSKLHRVTRIADGPTRQVATRAVEPAVFELSAAAPAKPRRGPPLFAGRPEPIVLDLPVMRGEPAALQYLAVAADPWPGAVAVWRSADAASFAFDRMVNLPAIAGRTLTPLRPGPLWRWDPLGSVDVELARGAITSITDEEALAGGNLFALRDANGRWEIVSAARAELVGNKTYRLTRLLRGLAGSEPEAARTLAAGALVVRLDEAVTPFTNAPGYLGVTRRYRIGPADRDYADPAFVEIAATAGGDALRPLSPVHVTARRGADGIRVGWIRRSRQDADAWEPVDVPLGEDREAYEVDILNGNAVLRTLTTAGPAMTYPTQSEQADFGGVLQTSLSLRVAQLSGTVGRGFERAVTVKVL